MENKSSVSEFILMGLTDQPELQLPLFVLFLVNYTVTVMGNLSLMNLICLNSNLHTPMYFFLSHLAIVDISYATNNVPKMLANLLAKKKSISFAPCIMQTFLYMAFAHTECLILVMMSYDRYVAICNPLHYSSIMTWRVCIQLATVSWTSGILVSVVDTTFTLRLPYRGSNSIAHFFCEAPALLALASTDTQTSEMAIFLMGVVILLIPVSLILVSYGHIIVTVVKMKSAAGRFKAFSTCGSHLMFVILFYGSAIITYMTPKSSKEQEKLVSVFYAMVTPMLNPLIYSLRNKDVKGALWKVAMKNFSSRLRITH